MKRLPLVLLLVLIPVTLALLAQRDASPAAIPSPGDSTDVLASVLAMHKAMPAPPTTFRPGHVTPRQIENYLTPADDGFVITLPARSLTPSPTVYDGTLYVSGGFGSRQFYAFDAETGAVKWALDLDDDGPTSAVVKDDVVVFNTESCTIFAVEAATGKMLWSHYLGDPLMSTPSIAGGKVFTAYPAGGHAAQPVQQAPNQKNDTTGDVAPLHGTHVLVALDLKTGAILWQKWIDGDVMSAPVVEQDELYVTTFPGTLYTFDTDTGDVLAAYASRATSAPVIVEGTIYMSRRADGEGVVRENLSAMMLDEVVVTRGYYAKNAPYFDGRVQDASDLKKDASSYDAGNGFGTGAPASAGAVGAKANVGQSNVSSLQAFQGSRVLHRKGKNYATMGDELISTDPAT